MMLTVVAAIVLSIGAVSAYAALADDVTPPVTSSDAVALYWNDVTIGLSATDAEGVAYIYHSLDDGIVRLYTVGSGDAATTAPTANDEPLSPGSHTISFWAQDTAGNVEARTTETFEVKADTAAPVTGASGAVAGSWYNTNVAVSLTAVDEAEGSGVAALSFFWDADSPTVGAVATADAGLAVDALTVNGAHVLTYQAADVAGNAEIAKTLTVNIDTVKPAPKAPYAATAYRGRTAALRYKVTDAAPNAGTASGKILVKNSSGRIVKTLKFSGKALNTVFSARFTVPRTWRAGTYKFFVYATDPAGNTQVKVALNRLVVR